MNHKSLIPLLDCDLIQYRCGFAADAQIKKEAKEAEPWADDARIHEMLQERDYQAIALHNVRTVIDVLLERFQGKPRFFLNGETNFRDRLATIKVYKGNRVDSHKPKYYSEIKEYLINHWKAEVSQDQESDDALGIAQCSEHPQWSTVICSMDKDMDQIPGYHYNWVQDRFYSVDPDEADRMLFWQMLVGDTVDNIPGINKIGKARANKILEEYRNLDHLRKAVQQHYMKQYGATWEGAYYEIGNLLYIRRQHGESCPLL